VIIGPTHKSFFLLCEIILRMSIRTFEAEKDRENKHIQSQPKFRYSNKKKRVVVLIKFTESFKVFSQNRNMGELQSFQPKPKYGDSGRQTHRGRKNVNAVEKIKYIPEPV